MVTFPPCKINLGLDVLARRTDGYHSIVTVFYPVPWTDVLEVLPSDVPDFLQTGSAIPGAPADNLCLKAYQMMQQEFGLPPVRIHLHKIIPTGAGLGGGSSDAAHMLRLLDAVFALQLDKGRLLTYASRLGSDCAFFLHDSPMLGRGRGEVLEAVSVDLKGYFLVLITPPIHVSTHTAYEAIDPLVPGSDLSERISRPVEEWRNEIENAFEAPISQKYPVLAEIKERLYGLGAVYAAMTGSGSSVFGLFRSEIRQPADLREVWGWSGWL